ncbi:MAG: pyruvate:ferredoxin (flavodoxin) oxidoreductase, partial [Saprospiraceae bacterium]|nr:pyruvate:ferredoxin (flavodoxin) oxidoreductase [Saprospiraceae bacterium]
PHSVIRAKFFNEKWLEDTPAEFKSAPINARGFPETQYSLQIYSEDCTGCTLCVDACPATSPVEIGVKAINMQPNSEQIKVESRKSIEYFEAIPWNDRSEVDFSSVRGNQFLEPLFEFSGACSGCGETPYLSMLSRLFGDRLLIANATGCSSIYGGNLPTTPWTKNAEGRGPAWSNSLFEDNAEFGLGMRVAVDKQHSVAANLMEHWRETLGNERVDVILAAPQKTESEIRAQRERIAEVKTILLKEQATEAQELLSVIDHLVRRSVWLVGGDGWAYDIGSAGVDHALASGRDINILVLDTEVYSNTGGQMSKATPPAATAKFAFSGKKVGKKDLALQAISYGNVYVAQIAMGGNPQQALLAMREAEAYPGPSLILAYSHCIAHGIMMEKGMQQQKLAVESAYWPLLRYNPELRKADHNPFVLDSPRPRKALEDYIYNEMRYKILTKTNPVEADRLLKLAKELVDLKWKTYEEMATKPASEFQPA